MRRLGRRACRLLVGPRLAGLGQQVAQRVVPGRVDLVAYLEEVPVVVGLAASPAVVEVPAASLEVAVGLAGEPMEGQEAHPPA